MRKVTLVRNPSTDDGTFGVMLLDDHSSFCTGELPWKDNQNGISCIEPAPGATKSYVCKWIDSPKHGQCYMVTGVAGRDMIEIHSANFMGDQQTGKISQLLGCIALGKSVGKLEGQTAILASKVAIAEFEAKMQQQDFELTIMWRP